VVEGAEGRDRDERRDFSDEHDDDHDGADMKPSHRGIPSWDETIAIIVDANLESRAKNPNAAGRGGSRGRGRGRGRRS
jgi:hypothetical protein